MQRDWDGGTSFPNTSLCSNDRSEKCGDAMLVMCATVTARLDTRNSAKDSGTVDYKKVDVKGQSSLSSAPKTKESAEGTQQYTSVTIEVRYCSMVNVLTSRSGSIETFFSLPTVLSLAPRVQQLLSSCCRGRGCRPCACGNCRGVSNSITSSTLLVF